MELKDILIPILTLLVGGLSVWFWRGRDKKDAAELKVSTDAQVAGLEIEKRLRLVERTQAVISEQVRPVSEMLLSLLRKELEHYHTPEMDALMKKLGGEVVPRTITSAEEKRLLTLVAEWTVKVDSEIDDDERDAAGMFPFALRRAKREAEAIAGGAAFEHAQMIGLLPKGEHPEVAS